MSGNGTVWLLAGRPGMGRSVLARMIVRWVRKQHRAAYCSAEDGAMTMEALTRCLETWGGADLIVIDELRDLPEFRRGSCEKISALLTGLKALSARTGAPVLLVSGLSRRVESRRDHVPRLADIPHWSKIAPWLDGAALLYRPAYYDPAADRASAWCFISQPPFNYLIPARLFWDDRTKTFQAG